MQITDDSELIKLFQKEEDREYVFRLIVDKYKEKLYRHIRSIVLDHYDTDDVLQETFLKVWRALPGFREESGLYTWLYRIATNETLSFLRKKKKHLLVSFTGIENKMAEKLTEDEYFNGDAVQLKLQKAVLTLPEKQKLIFNMKYFNEMKYEDMSAILNTSVGALKASYHHAVKKIEKYMNTD